MRAHTRGPYGPSARRSIKIHVPLLETAYKMATQLWNILIPRASRFISDIGISIISGCAFMNISHATDCIFRCNHVQTARYSDKLCFIIFVCWRRRCACAKKLSLLVGEQFECLTHIRAFPNWIYNQHLFPAVFYFSTFIYPYFIGKKLS